MKVHELIESCGEELVHQWLSECLIGMSQGKRGTKVTFATDAVSAVKELTHSNDKVGLICWIPRAAYEKAFEKKDQEKG